MARHRIAQWLFHHQQEQQQHHHHHQAMAPDDREERGYAPSPSIASAANGKPPPPDAASRPLTVATTHVSALVPPGDKLLVFRSLTGIDTVPALVRAGHAARTAPNIGLYTRVVRAEASAARAFRVFNLLVNTCLGVQIVVAAVLTAIGAANGPHGAVTALGALNTIIAGFLTYLKGSGLPNRLKYHENKWKTVREHIEQRERELCLADCPLDALDEVRVVEDMYQRVKMELDANQNPGSSDGAFHDRPRPPYGYHPRGPAEEPARPPAPAPAPAAPQPPPASTHVPPGAFDEKS